jgi:hypothetical protein
VNRRFSWYELLSVNASRRKFEILRRLSRGCVALSSTCEGSIESAKHVVMVAEFVKDESSILSTSKIQIKPNQITLRIPKT